MMMLISIGTIIGILVVVLLIVLIANFLKK